jgi:diguanylate cyclase (GGDEF)-like protein
MEHLLVGAARSLTLPDAQRALWEALVDTLVAAVESGSDALFLDAIEAQSRLTGIEGDRRLIEVFQALQDGLEGLRAAVLAAQPGDEAEAVSGRLRELEGEAIMRAGVGYAEGLEERVDNLTGQIETLSPHDELTGAMKLPQVQNQLVLEISRCQRMDLSLGVAALVIEGLDELSRHNGGHAAEKELSRAGRLLRESLRRYDSIGRLSDNEFIVVLPDVSRSGLASAMERLRRSLETGEERPANVQFLFVLLHLDVVDVGAAEIVASIRRGLTQVRGGERYVVWM